MNSRKHLLRIIVPSLVIGIVFVGLPTWYVYAYCPPDLVKNTDGFIQKLARLVLTPIAQAGPCVRFIRGGGGGPPPPTCLTGDNRCYALGRNTTTSEWGGGYAEWNMRKYPAPSNVLADGHTNQTIWVTTDNTTGANWVEVGYTRGIDGNDTSTYYWAKNKGLNYSHARVTSMNPGVEGTNHTYDVHAWTPTNYRGFIDGTQVVSVTDQGVSTKRIDVGLETTDANSNIGHTYPKAMNYCDKVCDTSANWHPWTSQTEDSELPYDWDSTSTSRGHNWNSNFAATLETGAAFASGSDSQPLQNYRLPSVIYGATGGPFVSQIQALDEAKRIANAYGNSNPDRVDVRFTTYGQALSWTTNAGAKSTEVDDSREVWLVTLHGPVTMPFGQPGQPLLQYDYVQLIIDATTGSSLQVAAGPGDWPATLGF